MRKPALLFVATILMYSSMDAQYSTVSFDKNPLVYTRGVPQEFLLFAGDTATQILFNPARAIGFNRSFAFVNYLPGEAILTVAPSPDGPYVYYNDYGTVRYYFLPYTYYNYTQGKTLSFASLLKSENAYWLVQGSNTVSSYSMDGSSDSYFQQPVNPLTMNSSLVVNSYNQTNSQSELRIVNISPIGDYYVGGFVIYDPSNSKSTSSSMNQSSRYSPLLNTYSNSQEGESESRSNIFVVGLEYGISAPLYDFTSSLSYQPAEQKTSSNQVSTSQTVDSNSTPWVSQSYYAQTNDSKVSANVLNAKIFFQKKITIGGADANALLSSDLLYAFNGKTSITLKWYQANRSYSGGGWQGDTLLYSSSKDDDIKSFQWNVTPGIVFKKDFDVFNFVYGALATVGYNNMSSLYPYSSSNASYRENEYTYWNTSIRFPLYANYSPASWFSVNGGLTLYYSYYHSKSDSKLVPGKIVATNPPSQVVESQNSHNTFSSLSSGSNFYFAMKLKHNDDVELQLSFNNNIALTKTWNLSLGYFF